MSGLSNRSAELSFRFLGIAASAWVAILGALPPMTAAQPGADERAHWSFRPLRRPEMPAVPGARVRTQIDRFVLAKLLEKGLDFAPDAERAMLVRRVYLDLIGLPPRPDELRR